MGQVLDRDIPGYVHCGDVVRVRAIGGESGKEVDCVDKKPVCAVRGDGDRLHRFDVSSKFV